MADLKRFAVAATVCLGLMGSARAQTSSGDLAMYAGPDRLTKLQEGARREGKLLISTIGTQIRPIVDRFQARYPFLEVTLGRASSADTVRTVQAEYQAGIFNVDAFELTAQALIVAREAGLLAPFNAAEAIQYPPESIEPGKRWISIREGYIGVAFDTRKIPLADVPKSYRDLLTPKWKGRMAISNAPSSAADWVGAMVLAEGADFVRALGGQQSRIYNATSRAIANLMISGEVEISPTIYSSHVEASRAEGAQLDWIAPGPVPVADTSIAVASRAPHPNAALLYVEFVLSREAQEMYRDLGYRSSRRDMPSAAEQNFQKVYLANRPDYATAFEDWTRLFQDAFQKNTPK